MGKIAKEYERPLSVHLRKDGKEALRYFDEIIQVAEETGASIQILQLMYMVGIGGAMGPALEIIEQARGRGLDITADSGVYDAWSACIGTNIFDPGWEEEYKNTSVNDLLIVSGILGECCNEDLFIIFEVSRNISNSFRLRYGCTTMALQKIMFLFLQPDAVSWNGR